MKFQSRLVTSLVANKGYIGRAVKTKRVGTSSPISSLIEEFEITGLENIGRKNQFLNLLISHAQENGQSDLTRSESLMTQKITALRSQGMRCLVQGMELQQIVKCERKDRAYIIWMHVRHSSKYSELIPMTFVK